MQRPIPWFWIALAALLLLLPSPPGRLLLDVLGGITLTLLLLPLLLGGAGLLAWQILRRRLRSCEVCGFTAMGLEQCPACGTPYGAGSSASADTLPELDARQVTIDVEVISEEEA